MLRAAVIGAGEIALQHLACLRALPAVTLAGVCDQSRAVAEYAADRFGAGAWFTDHRAMFDAIRPDVVHVTTSPGSHFQLAMDALDAGAHVIVEKPVTVARHDLSVLLQSAADKRRVLIEDYNYLFNAPVQRIASLIASGELGTVVHVEVVLCLDLGDGNPSGVPPRISPERSGPSGVIGDYLPHLASVTHFVVGAHRAVRSHWPEPSIGSSQPRGELRAIVDGERATATITFSAQGQPDTFWLQVHGTRMRVSADLYDMTVVIDRLGNGPRPVARLLNRVRGARHLRRTATRGFYNKLTDGMGIYDGLWSLLGRTYAALESGSAPPISPCQIAEVNDLVAALGAGEFRF
jgi:predicted dehydrogenase